MGNEWEQPASGSGAGKHMYGWAVGGKTVLMGRGEGGRSEDGGRERGLPACLRIAQGRAAGLMVCAQGMLAGTLGGCLPRAPWLADAFAQLQMGLAALVSPACTSAQVRPTVQVGLSLPFQAVRTWPGPTCREAKGGTVHRRRADELSWEGAKRLQRCTLCPRHEERQPLQCTALNLPRCKTPCRPRPPCRTGPCR